MAMVEKQSGIKAELIPYKTTDQSSQGAGLRRGAQAVRRHRRADRLQTAI